MPWTSWTTVPHVDWIQASNNQPNNGSKNEIIITKKITNKTITYVYYNTEISGL